MGISVRFGSDIYELGKVHRVIAYIRQQRLFDQFIASAVFRQVHPIVARLQVVFLQLLAAFLHRDQDALGPNEVRELRGVVPAHAVFQFAASFDDAGVAEGLEKAIKEDLRFAFFVALELGGEGDEFLDFWHDGLHG